MAHTMSIGKFLGAFTKRKHPLIRTKSFKKRSKSKKALAAHEKQLDSSLCVTALFILAFVACFTGFSYIYGTFSDRAKIDPSPTRIFYSH